MPDETNRAWEERYGSAAAAAALSGILLGGSALAAEALGFDDDSIPRLLIAAEVAGSALFAIGVLGGIALGVAGSVSRWRQNR